MKTNNGLEEGYVFVEAAIVYPIITLIFFVIFYAAIFVYEKATLQSSIENAVIYYKSEKTDTYVSMLGEFEKTLDSRIGNKFDGVSYKNPYRNIGSTLSGVLQSIISKFGKPDKDPGSTTTIGNFIRNTGGRDINVTKVKEEDVYLFKKVEVMANKALSASVNINKVGGKKNITIESKAKFVILDSENLIRDVDFVADLIKDTKVGELYGKLKDKTSETYNKFKNKIENKDNWNNTSRTVNLTKSF